MIKKLLASIRAQSDTAGVDEALRLLEAARASYGDAERALAAARNAYRASLLADDDADAVAKRAEVERAEVMVDRADAAIGLAESKHAEAAARAAEIERRSGYEAAQAKIRTAVKALRGYPAHALAIRAIMKSVAEANSAISALGDDLPEGALPLVPPELQVRRLPGTPERELSRERLPDRWYYTGEQAMWGEVLPQYVPSIIKTGRTTGELETRDPESKLLRRFPVELRPAGTKVIFMPQKAGVHPEALHTQIVLPGLSVCDPDIWRPLGNLNWGYALGQDGATVLQAVAEREAARPQTPEAMQPDGAPGERILPPPVPAPVQEAAV